MKELIASICRHWRNRADSEAIERLLQRVPGDGAVASLAPVDQLHVGQLESTAAFAAWVGVRAGSRVLDLGSGLGGPARYLASAHGATVHAVEVVPELHAAAVALTERLGLAGRVGHELADAASCAAPGPFDLAWLEHVDMHVQEKRALYAKAKALLAPGGRIAWHDWLAGPGGAPHWPLFWSADGAISFLSTEEGFATDLAAAGLSLRRFEPIPGPTLGWLGASSGVLAAALGKAGARAPQEPARIERLRRLIEETENARRSVAEQRIVPFFAEAAADWTSIRQCF